MVKLLEARQSLADQAQDLGYFNGFEFIYIFLYMSPLAAISTASLNVRLYLQWYPGRSSRLLFTDCSQNQAM